MLVIEHRINTVEGLAKVSDEHGVEIDVRHDNRTGCLYLHHDPQTVGKGLETCADLKEYLRNFHHAFIIFNIKEAGIEKQCVDLAAKFSIPPWKYFLLDVEFPFLYAATRGIRKDGFRTSSIAVRYSEAEPIEMTLAQKGLVDWVWIDTNTKLPLDEQTGKLLMENFKTCLVSPDRWRPELAEKEIQEYHKQIEKIRFRLDAVMVGKEFMKFWI